MWAFTALWFPPAEISLWTCSLLPEEEEEEEEEEDLDTLEVYSKMCLLLLTASFLYKGGGGGAGALLNYTGQVKPSGSYTISVGAGGASGTNGRNSAAFNWTAIGGGAGGSPCSSAPLS